jgi:hypothetical protein
MQVCHGKASPLRRLRPGDGVAYYSPTLALGSKLPYRAITAVGIVAEDEPFLFDMGGGFQPWRLSVRWKAGREMPIAPLLPELRFSSGRKNWGQQLRFGLLAICPEDFAVILNATAVME